MTLSDEQLERRLADLFAAIDDQLELPAAPARRRDRLRRTMLAAAAVVILASAGIGLLSMRRSAVEVQLSSRPTIAPVEFDRRVGELCRALDQARTGVAPRFETAEAYLVVVESRRRAVSTFIDGLLDVPPPSDAVAVPAAVLAALREPRARLDEVEQAARQGRLQDAAADWAEVDVGIDEAMQVLQDHGAAPCG